MAEAVRGTEELTRTDWVACVGQVDNKTVTVAMFGHPENARHPTWWFTMDEPFAYQSATLNLWKQPLTLARNDALALTFGVALMDGDVPAEQIESLYTHWLTNLANHPSVPSLPRSSK